MLSKQQKNTANKDYFPGQVQVLMNFFSDNLYSSQHLAIGQAEFFPVISNCFNFPLRRS